MFDIRVTCDATDRQRVTDRLSETFHLVQTRWEYSPCGTVAHLRTAAAHHTRHQDWPSPEIAYAHAPDIASEIEWTTTHRTTSGPHCPPEREFWLRKAATLDRIALADEGDVAGDATELATDAACQLLHMDAITSALTIGDYVGVPYGPHHPASEADPVGYLRQEYAHWITTARQNSPVQDTEEQQLGDDFEPCGDGMCQCDCVGLNHPCGCDCDFTDEDGITEAEAFALRPPQRTNTSNHSF